jgi:hypothetical protein
MDEIEQLLSELSKQFEGMLAHLAWQEENDRLNPPLEPWQEEWVARRAYEDYQAGRLL